MALASAYTLSNILELLRSVEMMDVAGGFSEVRAMSLSIDGTGATDAGRLALPNVVSTATETRPKYGGDIIFAGGSTPFSKASPACVERLPGSGLTGRATLIGWLVEAARRRGAAEAGRLVEETRPRACTASATSILLSGSNIFTR